MLMDPNTNYSEQFYSRLPVSDSFDGLADGAAYQPLPDGWFVGTADIVGSTGHIAEGRYKAVNTVGAAVISAQINAADGELFPYVFGGDGASFAFPEVHRERATQTLAQVLRWAQDEFGMEMRGAIVPLSEIRAAGHDVSVARFGASAHVDYAMFAGGGLAWADKQMKAGLFRVEPAAENTLPDLSGLSCRWTPMKARNGTILSIVVSPTEDADMTAVAGVMHELIAQTQTLERNGHPVPAEGPGFTWPNDGVEIEARTSRCGQKLWRRKLGLLAETAFAYLFLKSGIKAGEFDPKHYIQTTSANADFRKFDDGLKMTIDCDAKTAVLIRRILQDAADKGLVRFGMFEQDEAIMTCIVPSINNDAHMHFVDGAAGGYTAAAGAFKVEPSAA